MSVARAAFADWAKLDRHWIRCVGAGGVYAA